MSIDSKKLLLLLSLATASCAPESARQHSPAPSSPPPLWGFADLHTHPAAHLAFGADNSGRNGILWGIPGSLEGSDSVQDDLPACDAKTHDSRVGSDLRGQSIHSQILSTLDRSTNVMDQGDGWPDYANWPAARSLTHQQMHAQSLYRAYQGGLRVLIADTVDTQLLSQLWTYQGASALSPSPGFDLNSAITQIQYIKGLAADNDWMRIVYGAAEARAAVRSNKLAVILGVEMDSLSLSDIDTLYTTYGVRHIIPIHLADNTFGGTAEYDGTFNSNNRYLNGTWETPLWDDCLNFQFDPAGLQTISVSSCPSLLSSGNCPNLQPMDAMTFQNIYGPPCSDPTSGVAVGFHGCGVRNSKGIDSAGIVALMSKPILLDVAHMSQQSADETLTLAEQFGFPVMDSHTGIRDDDPNYCPVRQGVADFLVTERSLPFSQAKRIAALHGVIGLGTAREPLGMGDGVSEWWADYVRLQGFGFTQGKGVALGTDANGLSWQVPHGKMDVSQAAYPVTVASSFAPPPGVETPALPMYALGSRSFDFNTDGIAVYGMLPDFLQAVNNLAEGAGSACDGGTCVASIGAMFHTAEDIVEMWELATTASANVPCGKGMQCCTQSVDGSCLGP